MTATLDPAPIDPLGPLHDGAYVDDLVVVRGPAGGPVDPTSCSVRTAHFSLGLEAGRLAVHHELPPDRVDDDLAGLLSDELFRAGWVRGPDLFERLFTGVVRTSAPDALASWELFYRNSTAALADPARRRPGGAIEGYAPVHDHAVGLVPSGSVLELGCCFGFLSLRLAAAGRSVTATDFSAGTVRLLAAVAPRLGVALATAVADATSVPAADGCADTVLLVHLLEHLDDAGGARALAEAVRLARRRVVVAVPLEEEADEAYGHVRTISLDDLAAWGAASGWRWEVHEDHGGWLVLDH